MLAALPRLSSLYGEVRGEADGDVRALGLAAGLGVVVPLRASICCSRLPTWAISLP
jgi:hypothetical protein